MLVLETEPHIFMRRHVKPFAKLTLLVAVYWRKIIFTKIVFILWITMGGRAAFELNENFVFCGCVLFVNMYERWNVRCRVLLWSGGLWEGGNMHSYVEIVKTEDVSGFCVWYNRVSEHVQCCVIGIIADFACTHTTYSCLFSRNSCVYLCYYVLHNVASMDSFLQLIFMNGLVSLCERTMSNSKSHSV